MVERKNLLVVALFLVAVLASFYASRAIFYEEAGPVEYSRGEHQMFHGPFYFNDEEYYVSDIFRENLVDRSYVMHNEKVVEDPEVRERISGLKNFYELSRDDPLFYSPYVDADLLDEAAKLYDDYEEIFLSNLSEPKYENLYYLYKGGEINMVPHDFLEMLPKTVDKTEEFYGDPSYENAEELIGLYKEAAKAYRMGIEEIIELFEETMSLDPHETRRRSVFTSGFGVGTTYEGIEKDLDLVLKNAERLEEEVKDRESCLHGVHCPEVATEIEDIDYGEVDRKEDLEIIVAPEALLERSEKIGIDREDVTVKGPYFIETACWGWGDNETFEPRELLVYYGLGYMNGTWVPSARALATERYYEKGEESADPVYEFASCRTPFTACGSIELAVLDFMLDKLKANPIYKGMDVDYAGAENKEVKEHLSKLQQSVEAGKQLEDRLIYGEYPSYSDLEKLGRVYGQTYLIFKELEKQGLNKEDSAEITGGLYGKKDNIKEYELAISSKVFALAPNLLSHKVGAKYWVARFPPRPIPPWDALIYSTMLNTVYMPWSDSVWRIEDRPQYFLKEEFPQRYVSQSTLDENKTSPT